MKERGYQFFQWSTSDVKKHFDADFERGLTEKRATIALHLHGPNSLEDLKDVSLVKIFLSQFSNFFIILLLIAATISYFVDGLLQSLILLFIIAANVFLGFSQEFKAEKAIEALREGYRSKSKVLRDGKIKSLSSKDLVVGDIIFVESGDKIPADLRIIEENSLRVNESALTGESVPVGKKEQIYHIETSLGDRKNMLYASTIVVSGRGKGIVVATGKATEFGKIAGLVTETSMETPLQQQVLYLGKLITLIAFVIGIIVFSLGISKGEELLPLMTFSIALIVAAVPEGLPTAITLSLAMGVSRMAKVKAIVRKMAVVETLGTVNIIATDKTGTLTNNKLEIDSVSLYKNGSFESINLNKNIHKNDDLEHLFSDAVACSNVNFNSSEIFGDPLEVAIVSKAKALYGRDKVFLSRDERLMEIPFDSDKQYMAVLMGTENHKKLIAKGTTEKIVDFCSLNKIEKQTITSEAERLSTEGFKVVALAQKNAESTGSALNGMTFLGLLALVDELAQGMKDTLQQVMAAGIRPIILTGDHSATASFVANKLGLDVRPDEIIEDAEFHLLSPSKLKEALKKVKIFARISPEDKLKIIKVLQGAGYSVAVTGDGVNDAPALKEANVGIAMGIKGTDIAKDSADIILSDDKYKTIVSAIEYGRTIHDNIKNIVAHLVSGNLNEIALVAVAFIAGLPSPITTLQILWINLITETIPALSFSFEQPRKKVLSEKPRPYQANSVKPTVVYASYLAAVAFILCLSVYLYGIYISPAKARTITFTFFVFIKLAFSFSLRSKERIWQNPRSFFENKYLIVATVFSALLQLLLFTEPLRSIFKLVTLNSQEKMVLGSLVVIAFMIAELIRYFLDKKHHQKEIESEKLELKPATNISS